MKRIEIIGSLLLILMMALGGTLLDSPSQPAPADCVPLKDLPHGGIPTPVKPLGLVWASPYAPAKFWAGVLVAILVVAHWWWVRPCELCGELREQCRCKPPEYDR